MSFIIQSSIGTFFQHSVEDKTKPGTRPVFTENMIKAHKFDSEMLAKNCLSFIRKEELPSPCSVVKYTRPRTPS